MTPRSALLRFVAATGGAVAVTAAVGSMRHRRAAERQIRTIASSLQRGLLPTDLAGVDDVDIAVRYEAGLEHAHVGGDWYDAFEVDDGHLIVTVGDVSGHGVTAMATMARLVPSIRAHAQTDADPGLILDRLHEQLRREAHDQLCTACVVRLDRTQGTVEIASAGHPPAIILDRAGDTRVVDIEPGLVLGPDVDAPHEVHRCQLDPGDTLALYSDGLVERRGEVIDVGIARLRRALAGGSTAVTDLVDEVFDTLVESGPAQEDDAVLLLCQRVRSS